MVSIGDELTNSQPTGFPIIEHRNLRAGIVLLSVTGARQGPPVIRLNSSLPKLPAPYIELRRESCICSSPD
jgi:hypothetical protein